jgi:hypothetical protein
MRNYIVTMREGQNGAQYLRIREVQTARGGARNLGAAIHKNLNLFKAGFQKALRFVSRTGR